MTDVFSRFDTLHECDRQRNYSVICAQCSSMFLSFAQYWPQLTCPSSAIIASPLLEARA